MSSASDPVSSLQPGLARPPIVSGEAQQESSEGNRMNSAESASLSTAATKTPALGASLRWNFSWTFVGNIIYSACQWGMLVVLAKIGNPEMVGQ
jgi:hypothetical protein